MHFIDRAEVMVIAGDGGNGKLSFRREKFVSKGGPDGGDGGDGGNVIFQASRNENTLAVFRFKKEVVAKSGNPGEQRNKHGRTAPALIVTVPVGTIVTTTDGQIIADLTVDGEQAIISKGGKGGFGNAHFVSSVRQAPRIAEKGEPGERRMVNLELKLIADVGVVGLPNAGKSTLLSVISNARPEIADYPFTTLTPNLGVVQIDNETSALFADIPGLIEGAAEGKGLGDEFLRHVERTLILVHVVDAYQDDIVAAYKTIQQELAAYRTDLSTRQQVVLLNKTEGLDEEIVTDLLKQLKKVIPKGTPIFAISAQAHKGLKEALYGIKKVLKDARQVQLESLDAEEALDALPVIRLTGDDTAWRVEKDADGYTVYGSKIERFAVRTDMQSDDSMVRLRDIMKKMGIMHELVRQGIQPGDKIRVNDKGSFVY